MLFKDIKRQAKHYNNSKYVYDTLLTSFSYFIFRISLPFVISTVLWSHSIRRNFTNTTLRIL
ncbi:hypothetical protein K443DRAFT_467719 [Laccaria amethystina LaAM-08-1]|uniref:Unplaced genomic scaffold K443scaffold_425, whole genome shotgun sequence n=1 Tax=Laccaria amethystina LaAM-08-1 TaxID=1095629 RepID=A0A0C9X2J1_9AGAR|nr:hypothetical protein K443DRAFT_467719 [Laccaria amethystina LaAM-08-1]